MRIRSLVLHGWLACVLVALAGAAHADVAPPTTQRAEAYTLPNGLRVILQEDHDSPYVYVQVRYGVGSKDELRGQSGLAHLFEHLMFRGSRHVAEGEFYKYLTNAGVSDQNAVTSQDSTRYFELVPRNQLA